MEIQALIDADIDRTAFARLLMRMQADLVLFIEKREKAAMSRRQTTLRAVDTGDKSGRWRNAMVGPELSDHLTSSHGRHR
jgi:hypothetical protein